MKAIATLFAALSLTTLIALLFVLHGNEKMRQENQALRTGGGSPSKAALTFRQPFLTRGTWTNVGLIKPAAALQTFCWALCSDTDALKDVSVLDTNNEPVQFTGMASDWPERLMGMQPLSFTIPDPKRPEMALATVITETRSIRYDKNDVPTEGLAHGILKLRFQKMGEEWRFAGRER